MDIIKFIDEHEIVKIGKASQEDVCPEVIVDDPIGLISIIKQNHCYIYQITWWDRVKLGIGSPIGYGGPLDPRCPNEYFFSETHLSKQFHCKMQNEELFQYFEEVKRDYALYDLIPSFFIKRCRR